MPAASARVRSRYRRAAPVAPRFWRQSLRFAGDDVVEVSRQRTNRFVWVDGSILAADRLGDGSLREPDGG